MIPILSGSGSVRIFDPVAHWTPQKKLMSFALHPEAFSFSTPIFSGRPNARDIHGFSL